jgi:hypothetical protein
MKKKKAVIEEVRQKESMMEAGQSTIDDGSKSQFLGGLRLPRESFSTFSSILSLDASKQCRDWLGVGFVLRT